MTEHDTFTKAAAHARISERSVPDQELKVATRAAWAMGDYHRFATDLVWELGEKLVAACGISPGQRVLDVAAGSGNAALRAAAAGARVVAADLTPENFEAGRREAGALGVTIDWVQADAEGLPFADGDFDTVLSSVGAMWAPNHRAVADELLRVCRPGGTVGMINFTPEGLLTEFLDVFAPYGPPPPPEALPPTLWGSEKHIRDLFGAHVDRLALSRHAYAERVPGGPAGYCEYYKRTFGPVIATYAGLSEPERHELDRAFLEFATRANRGPAGGPAELWYEYLLVVARRRDA